MTYSAFKTSDYTFVALNNQEVIFTSREQALLPLRTFLHSDYATYKNIVIYDKYIGRAAALLMTLLKPNKVKTPLISKFGKEIFEKFGILFEADEEVSYLMGVASEEMCRWEKISVGKSANELLDCLIPDTEEK